ncbi:hypothetical protein C4A68_03161 [Escherichia coli]|nr:hypothetical protein C4A73_02891 [Escherichia coli]RDO74298.1 hypothetical protein C4A68_03161 [Escherichia coli]
MRSSDRCRCQSQVIFQCDSLVKQGGQVQCVMSPRCLIQDINPVARVVGSADPHGDIHTAGMQCVYRQRFRRPVVCHKGERPAFASERIQRGAFRHIPVTPARQLHMRAGMTADITIKGCVHDIQRRLPVQDSTAIKHATVCILHRF